jgi:serine/threonine protein kinase
MAKLPASGTQPDAPAPGQALPPLGDLAYRAQRFLLTDSKMSEILVVQDEAGRDLVFKIACVRQRSRAATNRQAIYNSVTWLETVGRHPGLVALHPIRRGGPAALPATPPTYVAALTECPGRPEFIVLDYLPGGTLSNFVRKRPLPCKVTLWLAHQLAATLAHLHSRGCVHRDLKPENILFAVPPKSITTLPALQPVLIDFGVAAGQGEAKFVCGSRLWMAPELQEADEEQVLTVDPSWDIYALGLICCYMLSGLRPRRKAYAYHHYQEYQQTAFALCDEALADEVNSLAPVLDRFKALLRATLAKAPADRPTAATFTAETATLLSALGPMVTAPPAMNQPTASPVKALTPAVPNTKPGSDKARPREAVASARPPEAGATRDQRSDNRSMIAHKPAPAIVEVEPALDQQQSAPRRGLSRRAVLAVLILLALLALVPTLIGGAIDATGNRALPHGVEEALQAPTVGARAAVPTVEQAGLAPISAAVALSPTVQQRVAAPPAEVRAVMLTQTDQASTPPTLAPIPTLANPIVDAGEPIPTLAARVDRAPTRAVPTLAALAATPTLAPTASPPPTRTATRQPTSTPPNEPRAPAPLQVRLLAPAPDEVSGTDRVTFAWESVGRVPTAAQCYELVFWDPQNRADKRSPIGAGRESRRTVNLRALADGTEPFLRTWVRSSNGFAWGVRLVDCAAPRTILQDVDEERYYRYQP